MFDPLSIGILANIISTMTVVLSRSRLTGIISAAAWLASWLFILFSSTITAVIFESDSFVVLAGGLLALMTLAGLFARKPVWGLVGLVLILPFRLPVELFGIGLDVRKFFIILVIATFIGFKIQNNNKRSGLDILTSLIFLLMSASYFWAANTQDALVRYVFFYAPFALLYKTVSLADMRKNARVLVMVMLVGSFFISSYGLVNSIQPVASNSLPTIAPDWKTVVKSGTADFYMQKDKDNFIQHAKVNGGQSDAWIFQNLKIPKRIKKLNFSATVKLAGDANSSLRITFFKKSYKNNGKKRKLGSKNIYLLKVNSADWQQVKKKIKVPKGANMAKLIIKVKSNKSGGVLYIDKLDVKQLKIKNPEFDSGGYITKYIKKIRATSIFWDPNVFAKYLVFVLLLGSVALFETRRFGLLKTLVVVVPVMLSGFAALLLTVSRSGFLSLFLGLFILLFSFLLLNYKKLHGVIAMVIFIVVAGSIILKPPDFAERLSFLGARPDLEEIIAVSGGRSYLMEAGLNMVIDKPVSGFGLGSFSDVYPKYKSSEAKKDLNESHNSFFTVATEQGLAGLTLMLWLICFTIYSFVLMLMRKKQDPVFLGSFAVLMAFALNSLVYAYFFEDPFTWLVLGLLSGSIHRNNGKQ